MIGERVIKNNSIPEFSNSNNYIIKYYNKININNKYNYNLYYFSNRIYNIPN